MLLIPVNLLPISVVYLNGSRREDTIFSGILDLASGNMPLAAVVFIASILVPFTKVLVMMTLLLSIHFRGEQGLKTRIRLLRVVTWVSRWSMLDLFVMSLTMSLVNRDQLLAFTMGNAAFYFGAAVILTIIWPLSGSTAACFRMHMQKTPTIPTNATLRSKRKVSPF